MKRRLPGGRMSALRKAVYGQDLRHESKFAPMRTWADAGSSYASPGELAILPICRFMQASGHGKIGGIGSRNTAMARKAPGKSHRNGISIVAQRLRDMENQAHVPPPAHDR